MNYDMIRRWNDVVKPDDHVWYLGDFAMGDHEVWPKYLARLNGRISLVLGNHDKGRQTMLDTGFAEVHENVIVEVDGYRLWLNHYPPESAVDPAYRRPKHERPPAPGPYDIALCGHVHQRWTVFDSIVNVGVDRWEFRPVSVARICEALLTSVE